MNNFFRALIAGYGAKKLGGGCFGTILVFVLIWVALGQCSLSSRRTIPPPETYPADRRVSIPVPRPTLAVFICSLDEDLTANNSSIRRKVA
jgi:hypothetical protein